MVTKVTKTKVPTQINNIKNLFGNKEKRAHNIIKAWPFTTQSIAFLSVLYSFFPVIS